MLDALAGMSVRRFLREYWQKKPLLWRRAFPGFTGVVSRHALFRLASREDAEARFVRHGRSGWRLCRGPFTVEYFTKAPKRNWTLLLQDLNHFLPQASTLLQQFDFIPHARVDDVMVSYATVGGSVGPHFDSYDVFLLQGWGQRRWQISNQKDRDLVADAPLKILKHFRPEQEWLLDPGDMLYLPPGYAHHGVAMTECMTYSIGFRAPSAQDLASAFLSHLEDNLALDGGYADPHLRISKHPGEIPLDMVDQATATMDRIRWDKKDVAHFIGAYLSEPKPHVFFTPPARPLSQAKFIAGAAKNGLKLALKSRFLYRNGEFYLNGEAFKAPKAARYSLHALADRRCVQGLKILDAKTAAQLYAWYLAGFVKLSGNVNT